MNNTTEFSVPAGQRQLFLDDVGIERLENLTRTLHQPSKRGAVVRSANPNPDYPNAHRTDLGSGGRGLQVLGHRDGRRLSHQCGRAALDAGSQSKHRGGNGGS